MKNGNLSILVVGAGAIGGITAVLLKKNGYNVEVVCRQPEYASLISNEGIEVSGVCGNLKIKLPSYSSISGVKEKKDIILHATKSTDIAQTVGLLKSVLSENGHVISMQNGLSENNLASVIGEDRVISCVVGWGATIITHGRMKMTSKGDFIIGYQGKAPDDFLYDLSEILSAIVPTRVSDNIMGHLYSKLVINSCITSLGTISGLYLGKMLSIKKIRKIFIEIIREAVAVADAMKIKIEVFGRKLDFKKFVEGNNIFSDLRRHLLLMIVGFKYRRLKSSSLQSLERGEPTEIDYLNGYIVMKGKKHNVPVPINTAIVNMIHEIEHIKRKICPENFNDPVFG